MKLVVYGPERRLGALQNDQVIDLNHAYAKYLHEHDDEPLPYEMANAVVPAELGAFIRSETARLTGRERQPNTSRNPPQISSGSKASD
jgi:hypothetical protein